MIGEIINPIFFPTLEIAKSSVIISPFVSIPKAIIETSCFDNCGKSPVSFAALIAALVDSFHPWFSDFEPICFK